MWLTCCQCWKRFEIHGKLAEDTRAFYDAQPNHRPEKEVGVGDECWMKFKRKTLRIPPSTTLTSLAAFMWF